jgi:hypothetical protein
VACWPVVSEGFIKYDFCNITVEFVQTLHRRLLKQLFFIVICFFKQVVYIGGKSCQRKSLAAVDSAARLRAVLLDLSDGGRSALADRADSGSGRARHANRSDAESAKSRCADACAIAATAARFARNDCAAAGRRWRCCCRMDCFCSQGIVVCLYNIIV